MLGNSSVLKMLAVMTLSYALLPSDRILFGRIAL